MGKLLLVARLVARGLLRRRTETVLLLAAIAASTTTLTLGQILGGVTHDPYQETRTETSGPDVVAVSYSTVPGNHHGTLFNTSHGGFRPALGETRPGDAAQLSALASAAGVDAHSGPYPVALPVMRAGHHQDGVIAEGRDTTPPTVDQPKVTAGHWLDGNGEIVIERSFANSFRISVGDTISLNGRSFRVVGIAVTAAFSPYPYTGSFESAGGYDNPGLVWVTRADAHSLATATQPLSYVINLELADPDSAASFVNSHLGPPTTTPALTSWQNIRTLDHNAIHQVQSTLQTAGWLQGLLAIASATVLFGSRIAEKARRVGLLKAVGTTPGLVATILAAEYLLLALLAAAIGLAVGRLAAPALTSPGAGLLGSAGAPTLTASTVVTVVGVALAVAALATFVPAVRASRASTVDALLDTPRVPQRRPWATAASSYLPPSLLLGVRLASLFHVVWGGAGRGCTKVPVL